MQNRVGVAAYLMIYKPPLNLDLLNQLHIEMLRIRRVEEAIAVRYDEREMRCPTHFCIGQEAVPVGVSQHLCREDLVFSGHRSHGHFLAKGGSLSAMIAELYGRATGCAAGRGGSQHLIDLEAGFVAAAPILAGTIPIATGAAWAMKRRKTENVAVVYFGDGATEEGPFYEAVNYAAVHKLPILFVCENNLYSVHSPMDVRRPQGRSIADVVAGFGIPVAQLDGNDAGNVWREAGNAIQRIRNGAGPIFLEFLTYRWLEHCGPLDDTGLGYRTHEELEAWKSNDPLARSLNSLLQMPEFDPEAIVAADAAIQVEIKKAFEFARASDFPAPDSLFEFVLPKQRNHLGDR